MANAQALHAANHASNVTLSEQELAELAPFGTERAVEAGDVLYAAGDVDYDFFVILEGEVEILQHRRRRRRRDRAARAGPVPRRAQHDHRPARVPHRAHVRNAGRVLVIDRPTLRRMMSTQAATCRTRSSARSSRAATCCAPATAPARSASSARATPPRRWRCARSPTARGCRTRGSTSRRPKTTRPCCSPAIGVRDRATRPWS